MWIRTSAAVALTAAIGAAATDPSTRWYRRLRKPSWQPPAAAFPAVWTPLYGLAVASSPKTTVTLVNRLSARAAPLSCSTCSSWPRVDTRAYPTRIRSCGCAPPAGATAEAIVMPDIVSETSRNHGVGVLVGVQR
ncbi:hypothetical protein GCM10010429_16830 [Micromonospora olivasterospora]|uniref:TspO/MBR related protein n=2 Tax=Micromonospora olivasterospora TaxID=1880 RepID=A0A562IFI0_MICOL|nr:TspO/MBR related protein [Micromonospora olivasterospora]